MHKEKYNTREIFPCAQSKAALEAGKAIVEATERTIRSVTPAHGSGGPAFRKVHPNPGPS